ncbi:MAG: OmpA family protein [Pseudoxanthomonas sp.]
MKAKSIHLMAVIVLALAGCSSHEVKTGPADVAADAVAFPDPASATMPEGDFVNIDNLRNVAPGMTKNQLYKLLGAPHFNEGVFGVRKWNYVFDFRDNQDASKHFSCQYQIGFDDHGRSTIAYWKPASCDRVLAVPALVAYPPPPAPMLTEPVRLSSDTLFDFDRHDLTVAGEQQLSQLLLQVRGASQIQNILIVGYTDRIGSAGYNLKLSRQRADAVRDFLVAGGVAATAIQVEGKGEENPLAQCPRSNRKSLIVCLALNRRVELSGAVRP